MSGLFAHGTGSLVVLKGENENEVDALFASDPFVVHSIFMLSRFKRVALPNRRGQAKRLAGRKSLKIALVVYKRSFAG